MAGAMGSAVSPRYVDQSLHAQNQPRSMCSDVSLAACPQQAETLILLILASLCNILIIL